MDAGMGNETETRVSSTTEIEINDRIRRQIEANVLYYAERLDQIELRLQELSREWDIERTLQMNFGIVSLTGLIFGLFNRKWNLLTMVATSFFVQHAWKGWCPPVPLFRRLGVRTAAEISREKYALKALRGDFSGIAEEQADPGTKAFKAIQATRWS